MYTEQDLTDMLAYHMVNNWIANARAGNMGHEFTGVNATPENALKDTATDLGEQLTPAEQASQLAEYQRGQLVSLRFTLVTSARNVEATDRTERFFRSQTQIVGPVISRFAGYTACSPRYVFYGLRAKREKEVAQ